MELTLIGINILVKGIKRTTESKVLLPDDTRLDYAMGMVVSVGKGYRYGDKFAPLQVEKGNRVLYDPNGRVKTINIPDDDETYFVMDESSIIAILTEEIPDGRT